MLHGNVVNYTTQAVVQALSARMFSCLEHIVLVTPDVTPEVRERLRAVGSRVSEVPFVYWKNQPKDRVKKVWKYQMTKLLTWNLSAFDQVTYLDSDIFMVHPGVDELFNRCNRTSADLCAGKEYGNSRLNSGLLVVRPSRGRFLEMMRHLDSFSHPNAVSPDMAFLRHEYRLKFDGKSINHSSNVELFNVPYRGGDSNTWKKDLYHTCPELSRRAYFYSSVKKEDVLRRIQQVRLWHACGVHKLERLPRCGGGGSSHAFCSTRVMHLFQWLHAQANPCVNFNTDPTSCTASSGCKWCSVGTRCVPWAWDCHLRSAETMAVENRMRGVNSSPRRKKTLTSRVSASHSS